MNKEISLKKFLLFLSLFLLCLVVILYFVFTKTKPLCKGSDNPCIKAICNNCMVQNGKKVCNDCNIYNEKDERFWTGGCIYNS